MPRHSRKISSTNYYHIMVRGINKEQVFSTEQHKRVFLKYIEQYLDQECISMIAWCIMSNHAHFVTKAELSELSKFIKVILIRYSYYFNKVYDRVGPVFGDRFRSEVIEDDNSLKQVIRYVHLNPVKAGLILDVKDYKYCSYNEFIDKNTYISDDQKSFYLSYFNNNITRYRNFHYQDEYPDYFIDTKEDKDLINENKYKAVIKKFKENQNIINIDYNNLEKHLSEKLIEELITNTECTLKQISERLSIELNRVYYISKKLKLKN